MTDREQVQYQEKITGIYFCIFVDLWLGDIYPILADNWLITKYEYWELML